MASTDAGVSPVGSVKRFSQAQKRNILVDRPYCVAKYNQNMDGTELMDECISSYRVGVRSKKWYWNIFTWLLDAAINNAWLLYRKHHSKTTNLLFRRELVQLNPLRTTGYQCATKMAGKSGWRFDELENMSQTDVRAIFDQLPSENESVDDDLESVMNDDIPAAGDNDLFDIENMDNILENSEEIENPSASNDLKWSSDDDIPLARRTDIVLPTYWTNDVTYVTKSEPFKESTGPDLPDSVETPTDVLLHHFPEDLICHIVFQTNLYCVQKFGERRHFTPTTASEIKTFLAYYLALETIGHPMKNLEINLLAQLFPAVDSPASKKALANKIYSCGTIRKGRKHYPDLISDKIMQRGQVDWRVSRDGLTALKWMDNRSVLLLGNYHNPSIMETVSRRRKNGSNENIPCPQMIRDHNTHMGYVDRFDMLKSTYEIDKKSHKWWHRVFFYFVDACVLNAVILFQQRGEFHCNNFTSKQFRLAIARGLIGVREQNKRGRPSSEPPQNKFKKVVPYEVRYDKVSHMPERSTLLRCSTLENVHRTICKCSTRQVGLCLNKDRNCFALSHKK
ncbi:hypothetical protein NQ318_023556 [Aromia moschata]|uniref:PiggyBac transposable element-derived protein domain-containing protein n=1 Tax=Aromia moschata TaxID=1265417 RepID=A0AAV8YS02_9CUCU|nr:hypothetical protein NQ318_023556 [Aromia moschata]